MTSLNHLNSGSFSNIHVNSNSNDPKILKRVNSLPNCTIGQNEGISPIQYFSADNSPRLSNTSVNIGLASSNCEKRLVKILYIDPEVDEKTSSAKLERVSRLLPHLLCVFTVVSNAFNGLECTESTAFDMIFARTELPHLNAMDMLHILRQVNGSNPVPFVFLVKDSSEVKEIMNTYADELKAEGMQVEEFDNVSFSTSSATTTDEDSPFPLPKRLKPSIP